MVTGRCVWKGVVGRAAPPPPHPRSVYGIDGAAAAWLCAVCVLGRGGGAGGPAVPAVL